VPRRAEKDRSRKARPRGNRPTPPGLHRAAGGAPPAARRPGPKTSNPAVLTGELRESTLRLQDLITASRTRYLSLFDLSPIGYALMDKDGTIRTMNLTLASMLGHSRAYMEGHSFALSVVSEERPRFHQHMASASASASTSASCDLNLLGSGRVGLLPVHLITRAVNGDSGDRTAFISAIIDQRAQSETIAALQASGIQLKQEALALEARTHEAEQATVTLRGLAREVNKAEQRERQRIARLLHDDLQQLLVSAKMRLVMHGSTEARAEQIREVGNLIDAAINSSRSLTAQISPPLLHEAGLEAGLRWLARFVQEHHELKVDLRLKLGDASIHLSDRDFLFQAARELLFNVVKHSGVRQAQLRVFVVEHQVTLEVRDRGDGFDENLLDATSADSTGGMGLRTLRERVRLLGGAFVVHAHPGKGAAVHLDLPLSEMKEEEEETRREVPQPAPRTAAAPKRPGVVRVLIADDHRVVREGIQSFLSQEDWLEVVGQASNGRQAVLMTRDLQPDVVIMDISMPELNGIEATRIITGENPGVRIIGMSMHEQQDMAAAMRSAGAERYLTKGGPAEHLIEAVRQLGADPKRGPKTGHRPGSTAPDNGRTGSGSQD
jgi:PAS domain S-box-containing protein